MTPAAASTCPRCRQPASSAAANFCSNCGAGLRGPPCPSCNAPSEPGDAFCTACGVALRKAGPVVRSRRGRECHGRWRDSWGLSLMVAIVLLVADRGGDDAPSPASPPGGALGPTSAVDLDSMTPREAAERLFERVMIAVESGNQAEATLFLPMAIAAYDRIAALNLDDRFHLSLLHAVAEDGAAASAIAEAGLAVRPTHLLCLAAAAEGALLLGDRERATAHYRTLLDAYEEESAAGLPEYAAHADLLPVLRAEAAEFLAGGR